MADQKVELKVDGMDCANCAASITRFLQRKGLQDVYVNFSTKEVRFRTGSAEISTEEVKSGIHKLGYRVIDEKDDREPWWTLERKLLVSAVLTLPLLLHHLLMLFGLSLPYLDNPWVQFGICLPVFTIGFLHFGRSGLSSLRGGVPNMDVLIFVGSTAAFIYSLIGTLLAEANYIFYETSATIITLVLVGNWLEKRAVDQTTSAIGELSKLQVETAKRITPSGAIVKIDKDEIEVGHQLQVNDGDKVPADGRILEGEVRVDESMLTGESAPVSKGAGDEVIGASVVVDGNMQMEVTAAGKDSVLQQMIELVKTAQQDKPDIQRLADKISAIFVPVVLGIAILTVSGGALLLGLPFQQALMNGIAVLVISCPCAMGLATPTAVMVGVGRLARNGILVRGGQTLEVFSNIRHMVFDKTGTLTTGAFAVKDIEYHHPDRQRIHTLIHRLEQHSSHPIARSLVQNMENKANGLPLVLSEIKEEKGVGITARDQDGNRFRIGSGRILKEAPDATELSVFLTENDQLLATIQLTDNIKPDARATIDYLQRQGITPVILSGDRQAKTAGVAEALGVTTYHAEKMPEEKLKIIEQYARERPTAMVGDGINDAPALAKATLGVSLSNASQVAIQSAQIVLLNGHLSHLRPAVGISRQTVITIRQNLFWAFAYNIVAIPVAAAGLLNPMLGALFMAFSDVVVIGNSIRLRYKKIRW